MATTKGNQVAISGYLEPKMAAGLDALCQSTRVPKAEYLREAVGDLLQKHGIEWTRERRADGRGNVHTAKRKKRAKA